MKVFHAGTRLRDGAVVTSGGRVLCVTALGDDIAAAADRAYAGARGIHWAGAFTATTSATAPSAGAERTQAGCTPRSRPSAQP